MHIARRSRATQPEDASRDFRKQSMQAGETPVRSFRTKNIWAFSDMCMNDKWHRKPIEPLIRTALARQSNPINFIEHTRILRIPIRGQCTQQIGLNDASISDPGRPFTTSEGQPAPKAAFKSPLLDHNYAQSTSA